MLKDYTYRARRVREDAWRSLPDGYVLCTRLLRFAAACLLGGMMQAHAGAQTMPGLPPPRRAQSALRPAERPVFNNRTVSLHSRGDLRAALDALFAPSPVNYVYALRAYPTATAPLDLTNVAFDQALRDVLQAYPAVPPVRAHLSGSVLSLVQNDMPGQTPDPNARRVTLRLKNVPVQDAFHALFAALGTDFTLDSALSGQITFAGRDLTAAQTVQAMTKQCPGPLLIVQRGNIIIIRRKPK